MQFVIKEHEVVTEAAQHIPRQLIYPRCSALKLISMQTSYLRSNFSAKLIALWLVAMLGIAPQLYSRDGIKLYSVGNNVPWNAASSWSLNANGTGGVAIPQSNDTVVITGTIVQNINFSFSGNGSLILSNTGLLRGDNFDITFNNNSTLVCDGQLKANNLTFNSNSSFRVNPTAEVKINSSLNCNSQSVSIIDGKVTVSGNLTVSHSSILTGKGSIVSAHFLGQGKVMGMIGANLISDGSLVTENNWIGSISNSWAEPQNWSAGTVPTESSNIAIISSINNPLLVGNRECNDIYVNPGASLTLSAGSIFEVKGNLSVFGTGKMLLKNTVSEKASLILTGTASGKIQSEYPVLAGEKSLVSSPVDLALSSTFLNMYLRPYDEANAQWGQYIVPTTDPLKVMQGYELYSLANSTRIFEGTPNNSTKTVTITDSGNGLNLTGNPFPCFIDWENNNGDPSGSGNYAVYLPGGDDAVSINNGSRYIAPMQGFFVKAGKKGSLTVNGDSRVLSVTDTKLALKNNSLKFKLTDSNNFSDEAILRTISSATEAFDDQFDAIKLQGKTNAPSLNFTSSVDDIKYAVNSIPEINNTVSVPLEIVCYKSGSMNIAAAGISKFATAYPIILEDKQLNKMIDLRADSVYSFYQTPSMNADRFVLHFSKSTDGISESSANDQTQVIVTPNEVRVIGNEKSLYTADLFSADGKLISTSKGILSDGITLSTKGQPTGICFVKVYNSKLSITKKLLQTN